MKLYKAALSLALTSVLTLVSVFGPVSADTSVSDSAIHSTFDSNWFEHHQYHAENVIANGATPLITWMPYKHDAPDANIFDEIVRGKQDSYISRWLTDFQSWLDSFPATHKPKIALRFAHHLGGESYPWGKDPEVIKSAWRYLHTQFATAGVNDSVDWVWCANSNNSPDSDFVDWLSIDDHQQASEQSFNQLYKTTLAKFPNKPILLVKDSDTNETTGGKARWVSNTKRLIKQKYPAIKSIVWLDDHKKLGWAIDVKDSRDLAVGDNAISNDDFVKTEGLSATAETKTTPVKTMTGMDKQAQNTTLTKSIDQTIMPEVVGSEVLAREAKGIRKMSKAMLRKWRLEDILPR